MAKMIFKWENSVAESIHQKKLNEVELRRHCSEYESNFDLNRYKIEWNNTFDKRRTKDIG